MAASSKSRTGPGRPAPARAASIGAQILAHPQETGNPAGALVHELSRDVEDAVLTCGRDGEHIVVLAMAEGPSI
jgi:hypothetical protein